MLILDLKSKINVKLNKLPFKRNLLQAFRGVLDKKQNIVHMPLPEPRKYRLLHLHTSSKDLTHSRLL